MITIDTTVVPLTAELISTMSEDLGFPVNTVEIHNGTVCVENEIQANNVLQWLKNKGHKDAKKKYKDFSIFIGVAPFRFHLAQIIACDLGFSIETNNDEGLVIVSRKEQIRRVIEWLNKHGHPNARLVQ